MILAVLRLDRVLRATVWQILRGFFKADQRSLAGGFGADASCAGVDRPLGLVVSVVDLVLLVDRRDATGQA